MSDTDEHPAIQAPAPPAELWGVWDAKRGGWHRVYFSGGEAAILAFADAESARRYVTVSAVFTAHRLIPTTPNP